MALNYRKGLFRLWIVLSVIWIGVISLVLGKETSHSLRILPNQKTFEKAYDIEKQNLLNELPKEKKAIYEEGLKRELLPRITFSISEPTISIPEIQKFRQKYPEYNDLGDLDLARRLADKFPSAYGDLPKKVSRETSELIDASSITVSYKNLIRKFPAKTQPGAIWKEFKPFVIKMKVREVIKFAIITIGPPVALCILGFLVAWIKKGFKESAEQRDEV